MSPNFGTVAPKFEKKSPTTAYSSEFVVEFLGSIEITKLIFKGKNGFLIFVNKP